MKFIYLLIYSALILSCTNTQQSKTPLVPFDVGSLDMCEAACERRKQLNCIEPQFESKCIDVCRITSNAKQYKPMCVVLASTKEELEKSCRIRCNK